MHITIPVLLTISFVMTVLGTLLIYYFCKTLHLRKHSDRIRLLLSIILHDMTGSISSIGLMSETLVRRELTNEKLEQYLKSIYNESADLKEIVEFLPLLLDGNDASLQKVDLKTSVQQSLDAIRDQAKENGIGIRLECDENEDYCIRFYRYALERVLDNALQNAIKYTAVKLGGEKRIEVALKIGKSAVEATISDTGIGIPKRELSNIFNYRYRAGNALQVSGKGLGLYIVNGLMTLCGGRANIDSQEGKTMLRLIFPKSVL